MLGVKRVLPLLALCLMSLMTVAYGMQDDIVRTCLPPEVKNCPETEAIFSQWEDKPKPAYRQPVSCSKCQRRWSIIACSFCNTLYFNVIEGRFNKREHILVHPFSNFYGQHDDSQLSVLRIDSIDYLTAEHYFQMKRHEKAVPYRKTESLFSATDLTIEEIIANDSTPGKAWFHGKQYAYDVSVEDQILIMKRALSAKFTQNLHLKSLLLSTKDAFLVYAAPTDPLWGSGSDSQQGNLLGHLLMELRDLLRQPRALPAISEK